MTTFDLAGDDGWAATEQLKPAVPDPAAAAVNAPRTPHNFMATKNLVYVTSAHDVVTNLPVLTGTEAEPMVVAMDTETCCMADLRNRYDQLVAKVQQVQAEYDSIFKSQKDARAAKKAELETLKKSNEKFFNFVLKGGLNVGTGEVRLVQLYAGGDKVFVYDRWKIGELGWAALRDWMARRDIVWLCHYAQFDVKMLFQHGITPARAPHCTLIQNQALTSVTSKRRTLAALVWEFLGVVLAKELQASDWHKPDLAHEQLVYASNDVVATYELFTKQSERVRLSKRTPEENTKRVYDMMRAGIMGINEIMQTGIGFNRTAHAAVVKELAVRDDQFRQSILNAFLATAISGAPPVENPGSNVQIAKWLKWVLNNNTPFHDRDWPRTDTGGLSTGKDELIQNMAMVPPHFRRPLELLVEWADVKKDYSTYKEYDRHINPVTGRIHANVRIGGTETGRNSITDPALQTINRPDEDDPNAPSYRSMFEARPRHKFIACDYGQIEVRVPACLSQDEVLLEAIRQGLDIHALTATSCYASNDLVVALLSQLQIPPGTDPIVVLAHEAVLAFFKSGGGKWMRQSAKNAIFGLIFGQGPSGLASLLRTRGINVTVEEAAGIQRGLLKLYAGLKKWILKTRQDAEESGLIWTPLGRVYEPEGAIYTKSINTPCQGGAAEIMQNTIRRFPAVWGDVPAKLVHVVHDELVAEVPDECVDAARAIMVRVMTESALELFPNIPRKGLVSWGVGQTWAEAK